MPHASRKIAVAAVFAVAAGAGAASLFVPACGTPGCSLNYGDGFAHLAVPETPDAGITRVFTYAPCTAQAANDQVDVTLDGAGTCDVVVRLTNGDVYEYSVAFAKMNTGCDSPAITVPVDASAPRLVATADGGVD